MRNKKNRIHTVLHVEVQLSNYYNNKYIYYPTLLRRVQITRETSTNITRSLTCTRLILRKIKNIGNSEFWGNENVG